MKNRPSGEERVVLVHIQFPAGETAEDLQEFEELAASAGANVVHIISGTRKVPDAKYFVGKGKAEEIRDAVHSTSAALVLFNHALSPGQERNLERLLECRVLDRTGLILDIFAQRARSFAGKLQVELAILKHLSTRLIRIWTHLERQRGGIGLRGPGETQLEVDRRLIRNRIKTITARLEKLRKQREENRRARKKSIIPTVALVGYTNVGKSSLFNCLTNSDVLAANQLFATLDPTLRRAEFRETGPIILADTVGFIRHLPHDLIEAFHATLEEVTEANLLLHVVDANDDERESHILQVNHVLQTIEADKLPIIFVYNKIDLCPQLSPRIDYDEFGFPYRVYISAQTGQGIPELLEGISKALESNLLTLDITLTPNQAKIRAWLYECGWIQEEKISVGGDFQLVIRLPKQQYHRLERQLKQEQ